ncbi:polysaccharide deacetylase family protein [Variimorphobacter saccharofermentans]|jgi:peptidoglycan/xylan/chitin deacetylase (PgdA/CDA1 family)|nr:polysaccharide deacetylase family protein [Variimorphobacter saccharofermentans]
MNKKLVALTFDDGPDIDITPKVLDLLEKYHVVASFFLIGERITESTKPLIQRQISLGCDIQNHSWTHPFMDKMPKEAIIKEIQDTSDLIYNIVGVAPTFFRPPFIAVSDEMYECIDLPFINGINCLDWDPTVSAEDRADMILSNVKDGDIILLHDLVGNVNTVKALETIIPGMLERDFEFVNIGKLFELKGINPNVKNKIWTNVLE